MSRISCAPGFLVLALLLPLSASAKNKDKSKALPPDLLRAEAAIVLINPDAGEPINDFSANSKAREALERALSKWGRYRLVPDSSTADLVFVVRTGSGQVARPTVKGGPIDDRPVILQPSDSGDIRLGRKVGRSPDQNPSSGTPDSGPRLSTEIGSSDDTLEVYVVRARKSDASSDWQNESPAWRYSAKDALRMPAVSAVERFKQALAEAAKAASQKPDQKP